MAIIKDLTTLEDRPILSVKSSRIAKTVRVDPRGIMRTITAVRPSEDYQIVTFDCGHDGHMAHHFTFKIGAECRCFDCGEVARQMADHEMHRLSSKAESMMADAALSCTPDRCATAIHRAEELFNTAPHLAGSESMIGGCLNMQYRDLFALYAIASKK